MSCETLHDAHMYSVALFHWLAGNKTGEDFKGIGSPLTQQFIKGLEDLKGQIEDWLDLYEVAEEK